jgi:Cornichon protein
MSGEAWLYLLAVLINAVNLFLQVFFTIMYSDLEWYVHNLRESLPVEAHVGPC